MHMWLAERLFVLGCSIISFCARSRVVYDSRIGLAFVRRIYSWLCDSLTGEPENVQSVEDLHILGPGGELALRIYRPLPDRSLPAVIFLHGGCFCIGDLNSHDVSARALANAASCIVISVDYRLAPEHPFPAAAEDAYFVLSWVAAQAHDLGIDPDKVALAGDSAGGALAAVVARWARERGGPKVALQILIYPMTDAAMETLSWKQFANGPVLNQAIVAAAWSHYSPKVGQRRSDDVSPLAALDLRGLPPAVVITAENDPLRDEGEAYASALRSKGVAVSLSRYADTTHGFYQIPGTKVGRRVISEIASSLLRQFKAPASVR